MFSFPNQCEPVCSFCLDTYTKVMWKFLSSLIFYGTRLNGVLNSIQKASTVAAKQIQHGRINSNINRDAVETRNRTRATITALLREAQFAKRLQPILLPQRHDSLQTGRPHIACNFVGALQIQRTLRSDDCDRATNQGGVA
jgi:hypothetical protein